jgi:hypothetical protein
MQKRMNGLMLIATVMLAMSASAQTVTGSGTTNQVPVFNGSSTVGPSSITALPNGNVGIGTTAPGSRLVISDGGSTGSSINSGALGFNRNVLDGAIYNSGISAWQFSARDSMFTLEGYNGAAANPLTILKNGNVGIGTTSPTTPLYVNGGSGGGIELTLDGDNNGDSGINLGHSATLNNQIISTTLSNYYSGIRLQTNTGNTALRSWYFDLGGFNGANGNSDALTVGRAPASNANPTEFLRIKNNGNVGIGTTNPQATLDVNGSINISGAGGSITFPNGGGTQSAAWTGTLCGGDYAESVDVNGDRRSYGPGDVLVIDPNTPGKFLKSDAPYSTSVSGIYSTKPGTVGRRQTTAKGPDEVPMAVVGIVPAKVSAENGAIRPGDLLVSSSEPGYAMKGTDRSQMLGAVIGKAMDKLDTGTGVIEVLVTLQ